jgi:hypothetical protein
MPKRSSRAEADIDALQREYNLRYTYVCEGA